MPDGIPLGRVASQSRAAEITAPRAWTVVACLAFLFATAYAIAVVIFRLPIPGIDGPHAFRVALALHVELAVYFWLMASLAAEWAAAEPARDTGVLRTDLLLPGLAGVGTLLVAVSPLAGGAPRMADYFPWLVGNPWFLMGFVVFSSAVLLAAILACVRMVQRTERGPWRGIGITTLPALAAAASVGTSWLVGARELETLAWAAGHTLLFTHVAAMCWEWFRMSRGEGDRPAFLERVVLWSLAGVGVLLTLIPFVYPPDSEGFATAYTASMTWLLWPPALAAGLYVLRRLFSGGSRSPLADSLVPRALIVVAFVFFLIGNVLGAMIDGGTTLVTAHYHAAIGAVALTRMAMAYFAVDVLAIGAPSARAVRRQLAAYAMALLLLFGGLTVGAIDEAPRKTSAGELVEKGPYFKVGMSISGFGGLFAIAGSLWLVINLMRPVAGRHRPSGVGQISPD